MHQIQALTGLPEFGYIQTLVFNNVKAISYDNTT
jgi:hypothetical protein